MSEQKKGLIYAFLCYFIWGLIPIYWKFLKHVPLLQILSHRLVWSFVFYSLVVLIRNRKMVWLKFKDKKQFLLIALASLMLMINWLLYIYAVNTNHVVEGSLGYFINPFVNFLFSVFLLKEHLNKIQLASIALAAIGVLIITISQGHIPWIALTLAITFSIYGLIKRTVKVPGLLTNQYESFLFLIPCAIYLISQPSSLSYNEHSFSTALLLVGSGALTGVPLILFAEAAQRIPFYMMGFFQFLAPTLQFLTGVLIYKETLTDAKLLGFLFIWLSILFLLFHSYRNKQKL